MLTRILSAVLLLPVLLAVLLLLGPIYTAILLAVMAAIAAYELLYGTGLVKRVRPIIYTALMAVFVVLWSALDLNFAWMQLASLVFIVLLLAEVMADHLCFAFDKVCVCLVAGLVIPYMLSSLVRLRSAEDGKIMVLIPFLISFVADTFAYFTGVFFGKHKLAPKLSPKKTIEGLIGGISFTVIGMIVFCIILSRYYNYKVNYVAAAVFGLIGSIVSVFGDLSFSVIKRQTGIKDYGNLIPGHGGILDRFDSTIFVAPMVELFMLLWPFMVRTL